MLSLQADMKNGYFTDPRFDIAVFSRRIVICGKGKQILRNKVLLFCIEWLAGYLYRRDFIKGYSGKVRFTVHLFWRFLTGRNFIVPSMVSADACYYTNLCGITESTRVNLCKQDSNQEIFYTAVFAVMKRKFPSDRQRECNSRFFQVPGLTGEEWVQYGLFGRVL
jgi:hypothetical protein